MMAKFRIPASFAALLLGTLAAAGCTSESNPDSETGTGTDTAVTDSPTGSNTEPTSTTGDTVDPPEDTTTGTSDTSSTETTPGTSVSTTTEETTTEEEVTTSTSVGTSETTTDTGNTDDGGTTEGVGTSFATDVYPVAIMGFCSCHDGGGKLNLTTAELAFSSFVDVDSGQAKLKIVAPGDIEGSYLVHKLSGTHIDVGGGGDQMPKGAAPLSDEQITLVKVWIGEGAQP